jgi:hypothetical protein
MTVVEKLWQKTDTGKIVSVRINNFGIVPIVNNRQKQFLQIFVLNFLEVEGKPVKKL